MKKSFLFLFLTAICLLGYAQKKVVVKGGTIVHVKSTEELRAANLNEGQIVDLRVSRDVTVDGIVAIPEGTIVKCEVFQAKRSLAFGTRGRLGINIKYLTLPSGDRINFASSQINIRGKNRTPLSVIIFICTCLPLPCGSKAVLKPNVEYEAYVANNTEVTVE